MSEMEDLSICYGFIKKFPTAVCVDMALAARKNPLESGKPERTGCKQHQPKKQDQGDWVWGCTGHPGTVSKARGKLHPSCVSQLPVQLQIGCNVDVGSPFFCCSVACI